MIGARKKASIIEGPIFSRLFLYVIPIMLTGVLQLLYNTADQIVVGKFSGDPNALAAVGSTGSATGLIVNVIMGISAGAVVIMSQSFGARQDKIISRAVHTIVTFAAVAGVVFAGIGLLVSRPLLMALGTKPELLESATLYMRIILCGVPASVLYNFSAAVFRAKGDSKTPFIILSLSGLVNVGLNLVFVIVFKMGVAGVAVATITSQYISAAVIIILLSITSESYKLNIRKLGIDIRVLKRILAVGIPSGIQSAFFALSNMLVQSAVNTLTIPEIGGNTVAMTIENYTYTVMNAFYHGTITFVGQNYGARRHDRVKRTLLCAFIQVTVVGIIVGGLELIFIYPLSKLFVDMTLPTASMILDAAAVRSGIMLPTYFLCGIMEVLTAYQRGLGSSLRPMVVTLFCVCFIRVAWAKLGFPLIGTAQSLYWVYPVSWGVCAIIHALFSARVSKKMLKSDKEKEIAI